MGAESELMPFPPTDLAGLDVDPSLAQLRKDPGMCRAVLPYGKPTWLAVRHCDVKTVLTDKRFSRAAAVGPDEPRILPIIQKANLLIATDAPEHDRLRQLLASSFTVRGVERLRPRVQQIVDALIDDMRRAGPPADLMQSFALPLAGLVICELLGVPEPEQPRFLELVDSFSVPALAQLTGEQIMKIGQELRGYLVGLVERRHSEPGEDLLSTLIRGGGLTDDELVAIAVTVLIAGHEATADEIANFTYLLLINPEQLRQLRERPDLMPSAVEEMLRYVPQGVGTGLPRLATEDVEVGGVLVRAGEFVLPVMTAANHDDTVFSDADRIDLTRSGNAHFSFGYGVHRCLGAALARMELQIAIGALLRHLPDLRLAVPAGDVAWCQGGLVRAPLKLMVAW
ncbi:MAG TPA: cytochrome P450 [Micromonosporaceae bacterium]|nr:cytochrome P450 [Micromonosporaceae bacterium]